MLPRLKIFILYSHLNHFFGDSVVDCGVKWLVHPKMIILSVFTHPPVVPNLYVFIFFLLYTREDIWKNVLIKQISFPIDYQ